MKYELIQPMNYSYTAVQQIFTNRGIKLEDIEHYLHTTDDDILPPTLIDNIDEGIQMILRHLVDDQRILVIVDSDCDGYTSAAVLLNYLYANFPSVVENKIYYAFHPGKQHGIDLSMVEPNTGLVLVPDAGSNDYEQHKILKEKGIDVLVIDHHIADKVSTDACIINNQLCNYPNKTLSGVGMVYKVLQRFDEVCGLSAANEDLDLVATGLVGDMMSLTSMETRRLVSKGLEVAHNPFMKAIQEKNAFKLGTGSMSAIDVAFYVVPLINAVTRVGTEPEKETLFKSMLRWEAEKNVPSTKRGHSFGEMETIAAQAMRICTNVKNRQTRTQDASLEEVEDLIYERHMLDDKILIIKLDEFSVDRALSGLIANKLANEYQRPVAILNKVITPENQVMWEGSARGYSKSSLTDFRSFVKDSGFSSLAAGHPQAFGIGFTEDGLNSFIKYAETALQDMKVEPSYKVDFIWSGSDFRANDVLEIGSLKSYWGQNVEEPYVAIEGLNISQDMLFLMSRDSNPTIKINLPNGVSCLKFKSSEEEFDSLNLSPSGCVTINLVGKCSINNYRGITTPQIFIEDYEIVNRQKYYF